jgi:hypothetical protein
VGTKLVMTIGLLLIVVGAILIAFQAITYPPPLKVVGMESVEAGVEAARSILLPPVLGGLALVSGLVLVTAGSKGA